MAERVDLNCRILRWVSDEPQPGIVEASFTDAAGKPWVLIDKSVIFAAEVINASSAYPRAGIVRCEVLERRRGALGQDIVRVRAIDAPTTEGDIGEFEVEAGSLTRPS